MMRITVGQDSLAPQAPAGEAIAPFRPNVREAFRQSHCGSDFEPGETGRLFVVAMLLY
jgi:hypothetical protein